MADLTTLAYKDLLVWQKSLEFANSIIDMVENLKSPRSHYRLIEQIEAAATSVPMNIAEGKGRYSVKEFKHFLMIARGSLFETMTLIEIFKLRDWVTQDDIYLYLLKQIKSQKCLTHLTKISHLNKYRSKKFLNNLTT